MSSSENEMFIKPKIRYLGLNHFNNDFNIISFEVDHNENSRLESPEEFEKSLNDDDINVSDNFFSLTDIRAMEKDFMDLLEYLDSDLQGNFENVEPKVYKRILERWRKEQ